MMMEASFDTEESFDDPSCLAPQPPGSVSPAKRQIKEVKETKTTVSSHHVQLFLLFFSFILLFVSTSVSEAEVYVSLLPLFQSSVDIVSRLSAPCVLQCGVTWCFLHYWKPH